MSRSGWCAGLILLPWLAAVADMPPAAASCTDCHGENGMGGEDSMVPVIAGIPAGHIEEAIYAYIDGARRCVRVPEMCETVSILSEKEVFDIADYFAAQARGPSQEVFDAELAEEGLALHERHCARCHVPPNSVEAEHALGIPLHGQKKDYLQFAIEAYAKGDREALLDAMAGAINRLEPGDFTALVHYYASYRPR